MTPAPTIRSTTYSNAPDAAEFAVNSPPYACPCQRFADALANAAA